MFMTLGNKVDFPPLFADYTTEIGPLLTYRRIVISVSTVAGIVTAVLLVGVLYGYIQIVLKILRSKKIGQFKVLDHS